MPSRPSSLARARPARRAGSARSAPGSHGVSPSVRPKPGSTLGSARATASSRASGRDAHRVAGWSRRACRSGRTAPPSAKCVGLRLGPAAERLVDRDQPDLREARRDRPDRRLGLARPVEVLGDDLLGRRRVEEVEIGLGHLAGACACRRSSSTSATGGSARIEIDGTTISNLSAPNSCSVRKASFSQAISTSPMRALGEGGGRAARAGVEHRHVACRSRSTKSCAPRLGRRLVLSSA